MKAKNKALCVLIVFVAAAIVSACRHDVVMHNYRHTPVEGWDQSDVLSFPLDTVAENGVYSLDVGVRTTNDYPYQKLWLLVETELSNPDTAFSDTLACVFVDKKGVRNGRGTDTYQYDYSLKDLNLLKGQSGRFLIHHIMRREIVPGVSDVGLRLSH